MAKKCEIEQLSTFDNFRERNVYGIKPIEYLKRKLENIGYEVTDTAKYKIPEDIFYLEEAFLLKLIKSKKAKEYIIDSEVDFYRAMNSVKNQINYFHLMNGVRFLNIDNVYIDSNAKIGRGTIIYPNSYIEGETNIGEECVIGPETRVKDSIIGKKTNVLKSVVLDSTIGTSCNIGPFSYIRPECDIKDNVKIGDFVELKKTTVDSKTKIPHLTYIGDSSVGRNCNIACGVITANYDGKTKSKTIIEDNAFVGCNTTLVAPITVEADAYIAAGSTITERVKKESLAIARARQTNKENWVIEKDHKRIEK